MARSMRVLCCLVLLLSIQGLAAGNQRQFVTIPLESSDHLRFTGVVHLGSPPQGVRVVFDTGSSDAWVTNNFAAVVEGRSGKSFAIGYGSGIVSGFAAPTHLQLSDGILLGQVPVGFVDDHTSVISELDAQGVVGLGMETLAQIQSNSSLLGLLAQHQSLTKLLVFSIYISSWAGAQPESQLILGSDVPGLTSANTTWFSFPVVSTYAFHDPRFPSQAAFSKNDFGFWALRMQSFSFDNIVLPVRKSNSHNGAALLDSGTSVLLLPQYAFDRVIQSLSVRFGTRLLLSSNERALPACRPCQVHAFPPLAFDFFMEDSTTPDTTTQRFQLQGSDYVRCDQRRRECTAMIDSIHSSELSDQLDVVILGTVFMRAYYSRFDYSNKLVSLACTLNNGVCLGGLQPPLDYDGQTYSETQRATRSWTGLCVAATALALFAAVRILLQSYVREVRAVLVILYKAQIILASTFR